MPGRRRAVLLRIEESPCNTGAGGPICLMGARGVEKVFLSFPFGGPRGVDDFGGAFVGGGFWSGVIFCHS
jgi:hypothetical protein